MIVVAEKSSHWWVTETTVPLATVLLQGRPTGRIEDEGGLVASRSDLMDEQGETDLLEQANERLRLLLPSGQRRY